MPPSPIQIPISEFHGYLDKLREALRSRAKTLGDLDATLTAKCSGCDLQYSQEALWSLFLHQTEEGSAQVEIQGRSREGEQLRRGRCPSCGNPVMTITLR